MADPLTRLAMLEQSVGALAATMTGRRRSEAAQPTYLTTTPAGLIGATFTGLVNALGLVLPSATVITPAPPNEIQWQDSSGVTNASIAGAEAPTSNLLATALNSLHVFSQIWMQAGAAPFMSLIARASATKVAELDLNASTSAQSISASAGLNTATLIDQVGPNFLQLATHQTLAMDLGMGTFTFAASATSGIVTVTHAIGRIPTIVLLACQNTGNVLAPYYGTVTNSNFPAVALATAPITASVPFSWMAIG